MLTLPTMCPFEETVLRELQRLETLGRKLCVGLSGGMDSVALLEVLQQTQTSLGFTLSAIHVHHGLSPNADEWARFCEQRCTAKKIPLHIAKVRVDRATTAGLEGASRAARYAAFNEIDADFLLLAHHADDQVETVLHRLLRGSGITGLAGMASVRSLNARTKILRPMLAIRREKIFNYAQSHHLEWIEDESNEDTSYTRNFIRHEVNPKIAERFPHYRESITRMAEHAREHAEFAEALASIDLQWGDENVAHAERLDMLSLSRQTNALYYWLGWLNVHPPSQSELLSWAAQLFRPATHGKPQRAGGHDFVILRRKNILIIESQTNLVSP